MNKSIQWIIGLVAVVALVLSLQGLIGGNNQSVQPIPGNLGAGTRFPNGISANAISPIAGEIRGNRITLTTSDTATSTTAVGCIQTTATSTQTPVRLVMGTSGATTTTQGSLAQGVVGWQYGTCPA